MQYFIVTCFIFYRIWIGFLLSLSLYSLHIFLTRVWWTSYAEWQQGFSNPQGLFTVFGPIWIVLWFEKSCFFLWFPVPSVFFSKHLTIIQSTETTISNTISLIFHRLILKRGPRAWLYFCFLLFSHFNLSGWQNPRGNKLYFSY